MADPTPAPTPVADPTLADIKAALAEVPVILADLAKLVADAKNGGLLGLPTLIADAKALIVEFADCLGKAEQAVADVRAILGL